MLSITRSVLLTLILLRHNLPQTLAADRFGVIQPTISRTVRRYLPLIGQMLCLHTPPLPAALHGRVVVVDGTLVPTRDYAGHHKANYSGKRHKTGLAVQILATLDGQLLAASIPLPGRTHDRAAFALTGFAHLLAGTPTLGDLGYQGTTVIRPRRKRPGHGHHTPENRVWNTGIAQLRWAVEHTIAHWKAWKLVVRYIPWAGTVSTTRRSASSSLVDSIGTYLRTHPSEGKVLVVIDGLEWSDKWRLAVEQLGRVVHEFRASLLVAAESLNTTEWKLRGATTMPAPGTLTELDAFVQTLIGGGHYEQLSSLSAADRQGLAAELKKLAMTDLWAVVHLAPLMTRRDALERAGEQLWQERVGVLDDSKLTLALWIIVALSSYGIWTPADLISESEVRVAQRLGADVSEAGVRINSSFVNRALLARTTSDLPLSARSDRQVADEHRATRVRVAVLEPVARRTVGAGAERHGGGGHPPLVTERSGRAPGGAPAPGPVRPVGERGNRGLAVAARLRGRCQPSATGGSGAILVAGGGQRRDRAAPSAGNRCGPGPDREQSVRVAALRAGHGRAAGSGARRTLTALTQSWGAAASRSSSDW
jgi:hypothetical protein